MCCYRSAFGMWETTSPPALLVQILTRWTEGIKQIIVLIVQKSTITIPSVIISKIFPSHKLTCDISKENYSLVAGIFVGKVWVSILTANPVGPLSPFSQAHLRAAGGARGHFKKKKKRCVTCQTGDLIQSEWASSPKYAFINAKTMYLTVIILTPSFAKWVCKEKKSWWMSGTIRTVTMYGYTTISHKKTQNDLGNQRHSYKIEKEKWMTVEWINIFNSFTLTSWELLESRTAASNKWVPE